MPWPFLERLPELSVIDLMSQSRCENHSQERTKCVKF